MFKPARSALLYVVTRLYGRYLFGSSFRKAAPASWSFVYVGGRRHGGRASLADIAATPFMRWGCLPPRAPPSVFHGFYHAVRAALNKQRSRARPLLWCSLLFSVCLYQVVDVPASVHLSVKPFGVLIIQPERE